MIRLSPLRLRLARGLAFVLLLAAAPPAALADAASADAEARQAIEGFVSAVMAGDPAGLDGVLAPEFQILRADGRGYERAAYIAGAAASITKVQAITDIVATRHDDILVARWVIAVNETVDGRAVETRAPRLTVFRRAGGRWLVVSHANFAKID